MAAGKLSEINVTPLVDVLLVLLIIFMVTTAAAEQQRVEQKKQTSIQDKTESLVVLNLPVTPENDYLAVEKIGNVLLTGAENAFNENIRNLRFMRAKAECLTKYIPPHSVSGVYLNFSTPLPRQGYAKQRLTAPRFLDIYRELLVTGGFVSQKTDDRAFFEFSAEQFENNGFIITEKTDNLHKDGEKGVVTEYERKFIALNKPIYALKAIIKE